MTLLMTSARKKLTRIQILLGVVIVLGFVARMGFSAGVVGLDAPIRGDELDYTGLAQNLADGEGYLLSNGQVTARRPPGWPLVLAAVFKLTGSSIPAARVLQVLLGTVAVFMTFLAGRRYFGERVGLLGAALTAVNPFLVFISGYLLTENLYIILFLSAFLWFPWPGRSEVDEPFAWKPLVISAVLMGLATLVRPTGLPLTLWLGLTIALFAHAPLFRRTVRAAAFVAIVVAVTLPWSIRNALVMDGWVGLTTHGGVTFFQGNNPKIVDIEHYRGGVAPLGALPRYDELSQMNERDRDAFTYKMGRQFVRHNWRDMPRITWWKFQRFWRLHSDQGISGIRSGWWFGTDSALGRLAATIDVGFVYAIIVFPLALVGVGWYRRRWRELVFPYGVILAHTAVALIFFGSIRSRIPVEPVMAILAAAAVWAIVTRRQRGKVSSVE